MVLLHQLDQLLQMNVIIVADGRGGETNRYRQSTHCSNRVDSKAHLSVDIVGVESLGQVANLKPRFLPHLHQLLRPRRLHMGDRKLEMPPEIL